MAAYLRNSSFADRRRISSSLLLLASGFVRKTAADAQVIRTSLSPPSAGTVTLSAEAYADATGIGGVSVVTHPRTIVRSLFRPRAAAPTGTLILALARPPRGARTPSRLIPQ